MEVIFHEGVNHSGAFLYMGIIYAYPYTILMGKKEVRVDTANFFYYFGIRLKEPGEGYWNIQFMASHHRLIKGSCCTGVNRRGARTG